MKEITSKEYYNKVLGSWIGRIAGDFVGAPLEFRPYSYIKKKYGELTSYPQPIDLDYVNDDEMYEICALIALEKHGINLTAKDVAQEWINLLYKQNFTAEKVALDNLRAGIWPPESGIKDNIYYDAIGAQMRADIWGQITPGCPLIAKNYAEMDGSISHSGIGIEGEVYVAVLLSNAFFEPHIMKNIRESLQFVPPPEESIYTEMVLKALNIFERNPNDFREGREQLMEYWHKVRKEVLKSDAHNYRERKLKFLNRFISGVHVLPNIGIIILSLLYGFQEKEDPLGRSICIAAMMGLDTDCNCGNIGAILGAQLSIEKISSKWSEPLQNTFSTYVKGYEKWNITDLARRIMNIGKKIIKEKCKNNVKILE